MPGARHWWNSHIINWFDNLLERLIELWEIQLRKSQMEEMHRAGTGRMCVPVIFMLSLGVTLPAP